MSEPSPAEPIARLVRYTGRVQGVGFRATAEWIARAHPVAGWVRNLPDGRVELWAEGAAADVEAFLAAVRDHWGRSIRGEHVEEREPAGEHHGFRVVG
jgi:acylphosphatase